MYYHWINISFTFYETFCDHSLVSTLNLWCVHSLVEMAPLLDAQSLRRGIALRLVRQQSFLSSINRGRCLAFHLKPATKEYGSYLFFCHSYMTRINNLKRKEHDSFTSWIRWSDHFSLVSVIKISTCFIIMNNKT